MEKKLIKTYSILLILTILAILLPSIKINSNIRICFIMFIFSLKFILVAFNFMELKKANIAWKFILMSLLFLIIIPTVIMNV
ncbi:hypothetical protein BWK59_14725 [Flavobacterium davisii]|uniref:Cytochrome C oxidase subunit IV n=1 Tax=Flavobacterium davisii TaxID=2906077 RepID=A0A246GGM6_9FLAO|nr:hypothetical protein BWK59_14725 [Flavobacterium davisii]